MFCVFNERSPILFSNAWKFWTTVKTISFSLFLIRMWQKDSPFWPLFSTLVLYSELMAPNEFLSNIKPRLLLSVIENLKYNFQIIYRYVWVLMIPNKVKMHTELFKRWLADLTSSVLRSTQLLQFNWKGVFFVPVSTLTVMSQHPAEHFNDFYKDSSIFPYD